MVEVY